MSTTPSVNTNNNQSETTVNKAATPHTENQTLPKYAYFHLGILFLLVCSLIMPTGIYYYSQYEKIIHKSANQLAEVQGQLLEQDTLLSAFKFTEAMLNSENIASYLAAEKSLLQTNNQLALLKSSNQTDYQDWRVKRQAASSSLNRIALNFSDIERDRLNVISHLSLFDSWLEDLQKKEKNEVQQQALLMMRDNSVTLLTLLDSLTLQSTAVAFVNITSLINDIDQQIMNTDFIEPVNKSTWLAFSDAFYSTSEPSTVSNENYLSLWANTLILCGNYNKLIKDQQLAFKSILYSLLNKGTKNIDVVSHQSPILLKGKVSGVYLLHELIIVLTTIIILIGCFFLIIHRNIKKYANYCAQLLDVASKQFNNNTQGVNNKEEDLTFQLSELVSEQERLTLENELAAFTSISQRKTNALIAQRNYAQLYDLAIKQSEHIILMSFSEQSNTYKLHLYQAYLAGKELANRLKQARFHRYIQAEGIVLTLSDVNLISTTEAILLSQTGSLQKNSNELTLAVNGNITAEVRMDVDVFTEMMQVFIQLLCNGLSDSNLTINLMLHDKNDGQQQVKIIGKVENSKVPLKLPTLLQKIQDQNKNCNSSEIINYFNALLSYLHGDNVLVKLTDLGYEFSFIVPFGVMSTRQIGHDILLTVISKKATASSPNVCDLTEFTHQKFYPMPVDILVGVSSPAQHLTLHNLLQQLGFQVTFVAQANRQSQCWKSGRYAILLSEFSVSPFTKFTYDGSHSVTDHPTLLRGVFSLRQGARFIPEEKKFVHWHLGNIDINGALAKIVHQFSPWLPKSGLQDSVQNMQKKQNEVKVSKQLLAATNTQVVNLEKYIKHQGSVELAFFMLDEYLNEAIDLVAKLILVIKNNDLVEAGKVVRQLNMLSQILAAAALHQLCQDWQKIIADPVLNKNSAFLGKLLIKTEQEMTHVEAYAKAI